MRLKLLPIVDHILSANLSRELKILTKCTNLIRSKSCRKFIEMDPFLLVGILLLMLHHIMEEYLLKYLRKFWKKVQTLLMSNLLMLPF
jgi:hypothetical protein